MGQLGKFLLALGNMVRTGGIKKIEDAFNMAKQEFGEVTPLLKKQIERVFARGKKQEPGTKKQGDVVPFTKKQDTPDQASGLESLKNPFRTGGGLDPLEGMTRTAARVVLNRRGIDIPERADAIDIFEENFGGDALMDLKNVADELLEKETTGNITESMGKFLDDQGMFDLKIDKDAPKTMSDKELIKKITDDDPDRTNNAMGGINRTNFATGGIKLVGFLARKGKDLKEEIRKAMNNFMQRSGDNKLDADVILDDMFDELGVDRDMFDQKDVMNAYDEIYTNLNANEATGNLISKQLKIMRKAEDIQPGLFEKLNDTQLDIITKYGDMIDDNLLKNIVLDPDPNNQAAALATIEEAKIMLDKGMSVDEVLKVQGEALNRKKQAEGGLSYLMGM